jgi:2-oxoglutarate dehydrogenase E1 component
MIVLNITTAANLFHMMRRQVKWEFRKPAILFSPKSLLRHPEVASPISAFTDGIFQEVIDDASADAAKVKRLVLCTGKLFYELKEAREKKKLRNVALVRIEQLFPFPEKQVAAIFGKYKGADIIWAQEEPLNMGYWSFMVRMLPDTRLKLVSRKASASPATGYNKVHKAEQEIIINEALGA